MRMHSLAIGTLLICSVAFAQTVKVNRNSGHAENLNKVNPGMAINRQDRAFFKEAVETNQLEIKLGQIAWRNGGSNWAREYGKMMSMDHTEGWNELKVIGTKLRLPVSKKLSRESQEKIDRMSRLRGAAFDAAYRKGMIAGHSGFSQSLEREIKSGNNSLIRNYAITAAPVVKLHMKMAMRKVTKI